MDACGRTFLYLQFSLLTAHLVPIIARTRLWPLQRFTVGKLAVVAFVGTRRPLRSFEVFEDGQTTLLTPVLVFPRFSLRLACGKPQVISVRNISSVCVCARSNYVTAKLVIIVISDIAQSQTNKSKKQVAKKAELNNLLNHLSERRPWLPF